MTFSLSQNQFKFVNVSGMYCIYIYISIRTETIMLVDDLFHKIELNNVTYVPRMGCKFVHYIAAV